LKTLKSLNDDDYLFYSVSDSYYEHNIDPLIEIMGGLSQPILPFIAGGGVRERYLTKRDLFIKMNLDIPNVIDSWHITSYFFLVKKCSASVDFFEEWLALTQTDDLVTDAPSKLAEDYGELFSHSHVTSIFSLLVKKYRFRKFPEPTDWADVLESLLTRSGMPQEAFTSDFDEKIERFYPRILTMYWNENPFQHWVRTEILNPKAQAFPFDKMRRNFEEWGLGISDYQYESAIFDKFVPTFLEQVGNGERSFPEYLDMHSQLQEQGIEISWHRFNEAIFENFPRKFIYQAAHGEITFNEYLKRRFDLKKQGFKISAAREIACLVKYLFLKKPFAAESDKGKKTASAQYQHIMLRNSPQNVCYKHPKLLEKPIVVFTASQGGMTAQEDLLRFGVSAECFCDNNPSKQGTAAMGIDVISPDTMLKRYGKDGANILIGSLSYYYELHNLLSSWGVPDDNQWPNKIEIYLNSGCTAKPMILTDAQKKSLQGTLLEMMGVIHDICEKHDLRYCLYGGTLLGAVRHNGFIPWDDDIDIVMHRNDCKRFVEACKKELPDGYEAFSPYETDDCFFRYGFRKKGTIRRAYKIEDHLPGSNPELDIDIFTQDNVQVFSGQMQKFQDKVNNIIIDALRMRYGLADTNPQNPYRRVSHVISVLPKSVLCWIQEAALSFYNKKETEYVCWFVHNYGKPQDHTYKKNIFTDRVKMRFEDREFWIPAEYDMILRRLYGNYMQLPPEWARTPRHPISELVL
jgi:lipopolysaccharide cholinephosphotransferase